ncbi:MAG: hypothetical protein ACP5MD_09760, partial [Verrucomicrobiia bacterium]
ANNVAGSFSGDGAGLNNVNAAALGGVPPSGFWQTGGNTGIVHGRDFLGTLDNQVLELRVNNAPALRLEPSQVSPNVIGGFSGNTVAQGNAGSVIGGGGAPASINLVASDHATIGGGLENMILSGAHSATVGGGAGNQIQPGAAYATVGGGVDNRIGTNSIAAAIAGGGDNTASGDSAVVSGGYGNTASGRNATVAGGLVNTASGDFATVPGGEHNLAAGVSALAAGRKAEALHDGAFVWADSTDEYFRSTGANQFIIRAGGGVGINTNHPQSALHVAGTITADDFRGRGTGLSGVDADRLDGRDSTEFALLTHTHNAADIANGTLADARLSANIARLNATQTFAGANQFTNPANTFAGTFQGQGSGLSNLDAGGITSGTLSDARLSTNIPRLNVPANYTSTVSAPVMQASNVVADASSLNNGAIMPGLVLGGTASGEGIASKRTTGGNQFGLDLFTAFTSRFAIENNGSIHIGAGNSFASYGDARGSIYVLRGTSSGASYSELFLPGNQRVSVPVNSTWTFRVFVAGRASNGKAAGYCFRGFLENENSTVRMLEAVNTEDSTEDDTSWDANVAANDSYDALVITARGSTGDSVRWTAVIYTVEVRW